MRSWSGQGHLCHRSPWRVVLLFRSTFSLFGLYTLWWRAADTAITIACCSCLQNERKRRSLRHFLAPESQPPCMECPFGVLDTKTLGQHTANCRLSNQNTSPACLCIGGECCVSQVMEGGSVLWAQWGATVVELRLEGAQWTRDHCGCLAVRTTNSGQNSQGGGAKLRNRRLSYQCNGRMALGKLQTLFAAVEPMRS